MTFYQEASSWFAPSTVELSPAPQTGNKAPSCPQLPLPASDGKPTIITFLRHCGCPFAEVTFLNMRTAATKHPDIHFTAVSHSDQPATDKWLDAIGGPGDSNPVTVVVDPERQVYAQWGLGTASWGHVLSPAGMMEVWKLGREKGIWNRPTESGSRWQVSGNWAVDGEGVVRWGRMARRADEVVEFEEAIDAVKGG